MHQFWVIIVLLFTGISAFGEVFSEKDSLGAANKIRFGLTNQTWIRLDWNLRAEVNYNISMCLFHKRHRFNVGPLFRLDLIEEKKRIDGALFNYSIVPILASKRIEMKLCADMAFRQNRKSWYGVLNYSPVQSYYASRKIINQSLFALIGYALSINVWKRFYIENAIVTGVEYYKYRVSTEVFGARELDSKFNSGNIFNKYRPASFTRFSLIWLFNE